MLCSRTYGPLLFLNKRIRVIITPPKNAELIFVWSNDHSWGSNEYTKKYLHRINSVMISVPGGIRTIGTHFPGYPDNPDDLDYSGCADFLDCSDFPDYLDYPDFLDCLDRLDCPHSPNWRNTLLRLNTEAPHKWQCSVLCCCFGDAQPF